MIIKNLSENYLPNDSQAEKALLSSILLNPSIVPQVVEKIDPDDFFWPENRAVYKAILNLYEKNLPIDLISVTNEIKHLKLERELEFVGGLEYLASLVELASVVHSYDYYMDIIKSKSIRTKIIKASLETIQDTYNEQYSINTILDKAQRRIVEISYTSKSREYHSLSDILATVLENIEIMAEEGVVGLTTGFEDLDKMTSGLQRGDFIVIAARPSMGKTAFAINLAYNITIKSKQPVIFFSIEMSKEQIAQRFLSLESSIPLSKIRSATLTVQDMDRIAEAISILSEQPIFIDDTPIISTIDIRIKSRKIKVEKKQLGAIFIDYLQLIKAEDKKESRVQELSEISRSLKALAKELNVPVVALSQLSREVEKRTDKRPLLSDLRESGAIEQEADLVIFLYRDEYYNKDSKKANLTEVIIAKQRNGPTGSIFLYFAKDILKFFPTA
ncbi:MAG: replicative DNA helicase [Candidatus Calescibacterium sp.]|nr:replicative DNA helicase [Candidatus Calescibacterium sp.]MCX7972688.1 replicative DNA helicase [bacterium]MDW8194715.1 replicative DNA helicase [Candidatus Calescibacterium sp.]